MNKSLASFAIVVAFIGKLHTAGAQTNIEEILDKAYQTKSEVEVVLKNGEKLVGDILIPASPAWKIKAVTSGPPANSIRERSFRSEEVKTVGAIDDLLDAAFRLSLEDKLATVSSTPGPAARSREVEVSFTDGEMLKGRIIERPHGWQMQSRVISPLLGEVRDLKSDDIRTANLLKVEEILQQAYDIHNELQIVFKDGSTFRGLLKAHTPQGWSIPFAWGLPSPGVGERTFQAGALKRAILINSALSIEKKLEEAANSKTDVELILISGEILTGNLRRASDTSKWNITYGHVLTYIFMVPVSQELRTEEIASVKLFSSIEEKLDRARDPVIWKVVLVNGESLEGWVTDRSGDTWTFEIWTQNPGPGVKRTFRTEEVKNLQWK